MQGGLNSEHDWVVPPQYRLTKDIAANSESVLP
jgi:hypothetical protein